MKELIINTPVLIKSIIKAASRRLIVVILKLPISFALSRLIS